MTHNARYFMKATLLFGVLLPAHRPLEAQTLSDRIAAAPAGSLQFNYPARAGVCGDGRSWFSTGSGSWYGSSGSSQFINANMNESGLRADCQSGPVRVTLVRIDREVVDVAVQVGPLSPDSRAHDLGSVSGADGSAYLLQLVARSDGKPSRAALLPAMLADGAQPTNALLSIARDRDRPREMRRSAISWLAREENSGAVGDALLAIARDADEQQIVRGAAISAVARVNATRAVAPLVQLAHNEADPWAAQQAIEALGRMSEPQARNAIRVLISRAELSDGIRAAAVTASMQNFATAADAELLRTRFASMTGEKSRAAAVSALASMGGRTNAVWLLDVAANASLSTAHRRQAITRSDRAGVPVRDLAQLYDKLEARELREALLTVLASGGTETGTTKLLEIASRDTDVQIRRRAISLLSRREEPRVQQALQAMVTK
jgi:HEAT repeat protein